jgi:hypothetical protein
MRNIFVYSLPRSGTNFFSAYLHFHKMFFSINAQRYFLGTDVGSSVFDLSIFRKPGIHKDQNDIEALIFDEVRPLFFPAYSKHVSLPSRARRRIREVSLKRLITIPSKELLLYRNPIKVAESLTSYGKLNGRNYWELVSEDDLEQFYQYYLRFIKRVSRRPSVILVDVGAVFSFQETASRLFNELGTGVSLGSYEEAKSHVACGGCGDDALFKSDGFTPRYRLDINGCPVCGQELVGFGGFSALASFDPERFLGLSDVDLNKHARPLRAVFGEELSQCFLSNKRVNQGIQSLSSSFLGGVY